MSFFCFCTCFVFVKNVKQLCKHLFNKQPLFSLEKNSRVPLYLYLSFHLLLSHPGGLHIKTCINLYKDAS
jgi:hypothetical protein